MSRSLRIAFISGSLEPGKDGVGDYVRRLAGELQALGHQVSAAAINDSHVSELYDGLQSFGEGNFPVLRVPAAFPSEERFRQTKKWLADREIDWISLQFVPFAFEKRGLCLGLGHAVRNLAPRAQFHLMFHELWVGMKSDAPWKLRIWGRVQKALIRGVVRSLRPSIVHTQTQLYISQLERMGVRAERLPLFGNIPVLANRQEPEEGCLVFVHFGSIYPGAPIGAFARQVAEYAAESRREVSLVLVGRSGARRSEWLEVWRGAGLAVEDLGEQTPEGVSRSLARASVGVVTTPYALVEKSGSVAAMREHGLPVICVAETWEPRGFPHSDETPQGVYRFREAVPVDWATALLPPGESLGAKEIAERLANAFNTTGGSALRIAFYSYAFYPAVGGIESVSLLLATEFVRLGHEVKVLTTTPAAEGADADLPFAVVRNPSRQVLSEAVCWSDVYFQNNISLPALWPAFLQRKPWVVAHHTWIRTVDGRIDLAARLKLWATRFASASISVSEAMAGQFSTRQEVIGNAYEASIFRKIDGVTRERKFIFVGRLVSDKGVDTLLEALALLEEARLTIVGGGPDESALREQTQRLGLQERVIFAGVMRGEELARLLNEHRVLVVPSRWEEPYGIVALEGLASGCLVVGSERGGLKDAIGPGGLTFPNGDVAALAAALKKALVTQRDDAAVQAHLESQSPTAVAQAYLAVLQRVARPA